MTVYNANSLTPITPVIIISIGTASLVFSTVDIVIDAYRHWNRRGPGIRHHMEVEPDAATDAESDGTFSVEERYRDISGYRQRWKSDVSVAGC
jgi:hypothetical protein